MNRTLILHVISATAAVDRGFIDQKLTICLVTAIQLIDEPALCIQAIISSLTSNLCKNPNPLSQKGRVENFFLLGILSDIRL